MVRLYHDSRFISHIIFVSSPSHCIQITESSRYLQCLTRPIDHKSSLPRHQIEVFCEAVPKTAEVTIHLSPGRLVLNPITELPSALCLPLLWWLYFSQEHQRFHGPNGRPDWVRKRWPKCVGKTICRWDKIYSQSSYHYPQPGDNLTTPFYKFNTRGMVAMANSGPDSNKSQFFITYAKQPHLDSKYTIFGKVIDGADSTLDSMERVPINSKNRPLTEIKLINVGFPLDRTLYTWQRFRSPFMPTQLRMQSW
jgi:cyclophilin family peptidyl-prolyl cis-trans isomerase